MRWTDDVDAIHSKDTTAVCGEDTRKQSTCTSHNSVAVARSVLEKLFRLSLTNKLTDDQTKAIVALGNQLFQSSGSTTTARRSQSAATSRSSATAPVSSDQQSQASMLADTVVQRTVSQIRNELTAEEASTAVQRRSAASMLAETVAQQTLTEITNDLMKSDILSPKALIADSTTTFEKAVQVARSLSSTAAACPPTVCTELTKYIVMNAVDIALSCARRAAAKCAELNRNREPCQTRDSSLIDAFVERLSKEVHGHISLVARHPASDTALDLTRWIDDDLRRQCLALAVGPEAAPPRTLPHGVSPFAEVLMNLAVHDRLGDLQKNFVDGREMIELATCVLKSHVQSRSQQHVPADPGKSTTVGMYSVSQKSHLFYFLNNSVKHLTISAIFDAQNPEETCNGYKFAHFT